MEKSDAVRHTRPVIAESDSGMRPAAARVPALVAHMPAPVRRTIGWREWVSLPLLGITHIKAKIDTGARTSALFAQDIVPYRQNGIHRIRFVVLPMQKDASLIVPCTARVLDERTVIRSNGQRECRYVIETVLAVAGQEWPIDLSLANRDRLGFRMLLGRAALQHHFVIDPALSFHLTPRAGHTGTNRENTAGESTDETNNRPPADGRD
jgi:hypothetical protein